MIKISKYKNTLTSLLVFIIIWELVVRIGLVNKNLVSMPSEILKAGSIVWSRDDLSLHLFESLRTLLIGFFISAVIGSVVGIYLGIKKRAYQISAPYLFTISSIPIIALVPLIIYWFGLGIASKLAVVIIMSSSAIVIGAADGARGANKELIEMGRSFEIKNLNLFCKIIFFESLPSIFSGLRIGIGKAMAGLVASEIFGYGKGLGYLISFYGNSYQIAKMMFVLFLLIIISLTIIWIFNIMEQNILKNKQ